MGEVHDTHTQVIQEMIRKWPLSLYALCPSMDKAGDPISFQILHSAYGCRLPHSTPQQYTSAPSSHSLPHSTAKLQPISRIISSKEPLRIFLSLRTYIKSAPYFYPHQTPTQKQIAKPKFKNSTYHYPPPPAYLPPWDSPHPSFQNAPKPSSVTPAAPPDCRP